jgi:hypothetical protein
MAPDAETIVLDGTTATLPWPLELATELLADASPWGPAVTGPDDSRYADVWRLAAYVNAYHRHLPGSQWDHPLRDEALVAHLPRYTTQQLLDAFFLGVRGEHFHDGLIRRQEPQPRVLVGEVVRRVRSGDPPVFVLTLPT